jgi:energy-coupling factor transporter ATP-binding protein EcfA2
MEHLSGGEKTMAALALLFAVHSYQPSPFFVLDEVDAALDNANVAKLVGYIRRNAGPGMQFIVISLKTGLFEGSETLVGVMRDQTANSSKTLTLDVSLDPSSLMLLNGHVLTSLSTVTTISGGLVYFLDTLGNNAGMVVLVTSALMAFFLRILGIRQTWVHLRTLISYFGAFGIVK